MNNDAYYLPSIYDGDLPRIELYDMPSLPPLKEVVQTPAPSIVQSGIDARSHAWLTHGFTCAGKEIQERFVGPILTFVSDHKILIITGLATFLIYKACTRMGDSPVMNLPVMQDAVIKYKDGHEVATPYYAGIKFEGSILTDAVKVFTRTLSEEAVLERLLDKLKSREDIIAWIIKYQSVTTNGNGKDVIQGTVASGFVTALRSALASENLKIINDHAVKGLVGGLILLRNNGDLNCLNSCDYDNTYKLQLAETIYHRSLTYTYDDITKFVASIGLENRARGAYLASKIPTDLSKANLGASRVISPVISGIGTALSFLENQTDKVISNIDNLFGKKEINPDLYITKNPYVKVRIKNKPYFKNRE